MAVNDLTSPSTYLLEDATLRGKSLEHGIESSVHNNEIKKAAFSDDGIGFDGARIEGRFGQEEGGGGASRGGYRDSAGVLVGWTGRCSAPRPPHR